MSTDTIMRRETRLGLRDDRRQKLLLEPMSGGSCADTDPAFTLPLKTFFNIKSFAFTSYLKSKCKFFELPPKNWFAYLQTQLLLLKLRGKKQLKSHLS